MEENNNIFYNYIYLDPSKPVDFKIKGLDIILKHEPFYVGKGKGNRINVHKYGKSGKFMKNKMTSLKNKNIEPVILKLINNISNEQACENEKYLIKIIGRRDINLGPLCNLTNGGEGSLGAVISKERRDIISKVHKGKKMSNETIQKMKIAQKGKIVNAEGRNRMSIAKLGVKRNEEVKAKIKLNNKSRKEVYQLDLNNQIIKDWNSITEASNSLKIDVSSISAACKGKLKTAGKFKWAYK